MMDTDASVAYDDARLSRMGVRVLTPANTTIFEGTFSLLHCAVKDDALYRAAYAVRLFPIREADCFISLRYTDSEDKDHEIGIIEDLRAFPPAVQEIVRATLVKQYHEIVLSRIHGIENRHGLLFLDAESPTRGRLSFIMPWRGDRAEDYGTTGKILLDAFDNRYIIPDLAALPAADRNTFTNFIYW